MTSVTVAVPPSVSRRHRPFRRLLVASVAALATGCSGAGAPRAKDSPPAAPATASSRQAEGTGQRFPDIVKVVSAEESGGTWSFEVTLSSPYDSPQRYASGWRILGPQDRVLGEQVLTHDHADEQPVTRTQTGVRIDRGIETVTVEGKDLLNGYGGNRVQVALRRP